MIKGRGGERLDSLAYELALFDPERKKYITLEFKEYDYPDYDGHGINFTRIKFTDKEILVALANALQELEILPESATNAELKATKFHLEDMRKLVLGRNNV